jgi:hypothetical protein
VTGADLRLARFTAWASFTYADTAPTSYGRRLWTITLFPGRVFT